MNVNKGVAATVAVTVGLAGGVLALALVEEPSSPQTTGPISQQSEFERVTKTFTVTREEDPEAYFARMETNWQKSWDVSTDAARTALCERWSTDWYSVLSEAETPSEIPANITIQDYRWGLGDFLLDKCGEPSVREPFSLKVAQQKGQAPESGLGRADSAQ